MWGSYPVAYIQLLGVEGKDHYTFKKRDPVITRGLKIVPAGLSAWRGVYIIALVSLVYVDIENLRRAEPSYRVLLPCNYS